MAVMCPLAHFVNVWQAVVFCFGPVTPLVFADFYFNVKADVVDAIVDFRFDSLLQCLGVTLSYLYKLVQLRHTLPIFRRKCHDPRLKIIIIHLRFQCVSFYVLFQFFSDFLNLGKNEFLFSFYYFLQFGSSGRYCWENCT